MGKWCGCGAIGGGGVPPPSRSEATSARIPMDSQGGGEDTYGLAGWRRDAASPRVCRIRAGFLPGGRFEKRPYRPLMEPQLFQGFEDKAVGAVDDRGVE